MADEVFQIKNSHKVHAFGSKDDTSGVDPAFKYAADHSIRLHPAQQKLIEVTQAHSWSIMMGSLDEMQLLQNLVRAIGAKKTLDVGVYTGCSALAVALGLPEDGKIIACDINEDYVKLGIPFWKEAGVDHKIQFKMGPAVQTLQNLVDAGESGSFDFAFIDADKENYDNYYELCLKLIRKNGIIAVDNTLWSGNVYNPDKTDNETVAIRALNEKIHKDERVYVSFLVIGDGTTLAFKK